MDKDQNKKNEPGPAGLPAIDFATFVLSLASSAQVHLGLVPNPATKRTETDFTSARQTIDIIGVLKDKTKGNLTNDEERLLDYMLYDLRMKYVEITKK